jgi:large subunit ribosomal protein L15
MTGLNTLKRMTARARRRVGRGGKRGKTSGRGTKGQNARSGRKKRPELRDLIKKLPKRRGWGKNRGRTVNASKVPATPVSLARLDALFPSGAEITPRVLAERGVVNARPSNVPPIKIVGDETTSKKFSIKQCAVSAGARAAIEKAGGQVII